MDCPECFGNRSRREKEPGCAVCEYSDSCRVCCEDDDSRINRRSGHVSYDRYCYSREIAQEAPAVEEISVAEPQYTSDDLLQLLEFMLRIDDYSLDILSQVLAGNLNTASEVAKSFGVSRQAIHRKLVDSCTLHPELRKIFQAHLYRCRRILQDRDRRKCSGPAKAEQLELFY